MGLKLGFLRRFRHKTAKKERQKEDVIAEAKQKLLLPENQEAGHFFSLVKQFFSLFFRIKYNFDYTELSAEIQKRKLKKEIKESAGSFLQRLQDFEYGGESKPEELGVLIRDFEALVSQLEIKEETEEKKPVQLAPADKARLEKLAALLKEAGSFLDNNEFDRARGLYAGITRSFEMLGVEQKRRYYNSILKLHNQLALYYESKKPVEAARPEEAIYRVRETVEVKKADVPIGRFFIFLAGIIEDTSSKALKFLEWLRTRLVFSVHFLRNLPSRYKSHIYSKNLSSVKNLTEQAKAYAAMGDYASLNQLYGKLSSDFEKLNVDDKRLHYNRILWLHRQIRAMAPRPAPAKIEIEMPVHVEPKAEMPIPHPEILLKPVFSAIANAFAASGNSIFLSGRGIAGHIANLLPVLKSAYTALSGTIGAFSGGAASAFLKLIEALALFVKSTYALVLRFVKNLSTLPARYGKYAYNKKLGAVKSRIEKADICAEAGNFSGLRSLYGKISSDFKGLKLQDKRMHYIKVLALHRQIRLFTPAKPTRLEIPAPAEKPAPIRISPPAPAGKPLFAMPKFSLLRPRISFKPFFSSAGSILAVLRKSFTSAKVSLSASIRAVGLYSLKFLRDIFSVFPKIIDSAKSFPERYRESAKKRNIELLGRIVSEARNALEENDVRGARSLYKRMEAFFNRLPRDERLGAYRNIIEIHAKITELSEKASTGKRLARIDCLLAEVESYIAQMDIKGARKLYGEINKLFEELPAEEKKVNYEKIIKAYDKILSLYRPKTS